MPLYNGQDMNYAQLAALPECKVGRQTLFNRVERQGWELGKALKTPAMTASAAGRRNKTGFRGRYSLATIQQICNRGRIK